MKQWDTETKRFMPIAWIKRRNEARQRRVQHRTNYWMQNQKRRSTYALLTLKKQSPAVYNVLNNYMPPKAYYRWKKYYKYQKQDRKAGYPAGKGGYPYYGPGYN